MLKIIATFRKSLSFGFRPNKKNWKFISLIALLGCGLAPASASGQNYAEIAHRNECTQNIIARTDAMNNEEWDHLVSLARQFTTNCLDLYKDNTMEALALSDVAIGLNEQGKLEQGKLEEAIPVSERCITIKPDAAFCYFDLGVALVGLGRLADARSALQHAISIGGYDVPNASAVRAARRLLSGLPPQDVPQESETARPSEPPPPTQIQRFGTGFFVSAEGHIITNNHVVTGCKLLATRDGAPLSVVAVNGTADLALLKTNSKPSSFAAFGALHSLHVGDEVMAFGFPLPGLLSPEGNSTNGIISALSGPNGDLDLIQITAPVQPGNSGGPLVDQHGRVVGVIVAKLDAVKVAEATGDIPQNVNFAIRNNVVTDFLDGLEIPYRMSTASPALGWPTLAREEKNMSVAIVCTVGETP